MYTTTTASSCGPVYAISVTCSGTGEIFVDGHPITLGKMPPNTVINLVTVNTNMAVTITHAGTVGTQGYYNVAIQPALGALQQAYQGTYGGQMQGTVTWYPPDPPKPKTHMPLHNPLTLTPENKKDVKNLLRKMPVFKEAFEAADRIEKLSKHLDEALEGISQMRTVHQGYGKTAKGQVP